MWKSIRAIIIGWALTVILITLRELILNTFFVEGQQAQSNSSILLSSLLVIRIVIGLASASIGGYLTAYLAPRAGFVHAMILATIHLALVIPLLLSGAQPPQPGWYQPLLASVAIIGSLIGGLSWLLRGGGKKAR